MVPPSSTLWAYLKTKKIGLLVIATFTVVGVYTLNFVFASSSRSFIPSFVRGPSSSSDYGRLGDADHLSVDTADPARNGYRTLPLRMSEMFPGPDEERRNYHEWNARTLVELYTCTALGNCGPNQGKVALLAAHWFEEAVVRGWRGGEGVWGMSVYKHLRALGYTTLFANSFDEALQQYRLFPDLVKVVIRNKAGDCHSDPRCVKGPTNPTGIPAWKIFDFEYYSSNGGHFHASLMKGKWILSATLAYKDDPNPPQYIGYSIEDECRKTPPIPLAERHNRVWMLMKQLTYLYDNRFAWNRTYFTLAAAELNLTFTGAWQVDQHFQWNPEENGLMVDIAGQPGVQNLGRMGPEEFETVVEMSRVMVGMGSPFWSPSPYHALCKGLPFVNPILNWDQDDRSNKSRWYTQHPTLARYDPPYVYNVFKGDYEGFVAAVRTASRTEVPSFIPDFMTELAVRDRLKDLMEKDWRAAAEVLLQERLEEVEEGGNPYIFEL